MQRIFVICMLLLVVSGCTLLPKPDTSKSDTSESDTAEGFPLVLDHERSYAAYVTGEVQHAGEVRLIAVQYALVNKGSSLYEEPITIILKVDDKRLQSWIDEEEIDMSDFYGPISGEDISFPINDPRGFGVNFDVTTEAVDVEMLRKIIEHDRGLTLQIIDPNNEAVLYEEAISRFLIVDEEQVVEE